MLTRARAPQLGAPAWLLCSMLGVCNETKHAAAPPGPAIVNADHAVPGALAPRQASVRYEDVSSPPPALPAKEVDEVYEYEELHYHTDGRLRLPHCGTARVSRRRLWSTALALP